MLLSSPALAQSSWDDELASALTNGEFDLKFSYRYEFVDADRPISDTNPSKVRDANASTLRTRLVYKSGEFKNVFLTLNMDDLRPIVANDFDDTRNGKSQYAIVPDPKGTDLNLASLTWTGLENGTVVLGRQRIKRANVRFIGNVVWRQNEQTYDSISFGYKPVEKLDLFYAYVDRVKRVLGPNENGSGISASLATWQSNSHLLDGTYTFSPALKLFGYAYLLDFKNAADFSSSTIGLRATGAVEFGNGPTLGYQAEFARQGDYKDNPNSYDANYVLLDGALSWQTFGFRLMYEVLEGNGQPFTSFLTPLATLHKFNGWADRFLVTPADGLEDFAIEGNVKFLQGNWRLIYHKFTANKGGADYGDEIDFAASWQIGKRYTVLVKAAFYSADQFAFDTDKVWFQFTADF
ncbi:MAG: alginate export family protein [Gammaproteobacteria bacterium]|nr:alginate export family protein [Gammaproteobacteria bacterium]